VALPVSFALSQEAASHVVILASESGHRQCVGSEGVCVGSKGGGGGTYEVKEQEVKVVTLKPSEEGVDASKLQEWSRWYVEALVLTTK